MTTYQLLKVKKIGPGVYAVGPLGEIEMEQWVIDERVSHGLAVPSRRPRHLTTAWKSAPGAERPEFPTYTDAQGREHAEF